MKKQCLIPAFIVSALFASLPSSSLANPGVNELPSERGRPGLISPSYTGELKVGPGEEIIFDVYTVEKGDWLTRIAAKEYGDSDLWRLIYRYNSYIRDPHWIFPGDQVIVPRVVSKITAPDPVTGDAPEAVETVRREYRHFLANPEFEFDGIIAGFQREKILQAQGDYCFINLGSDHGIRENMILNVYERGRRIANPETGRVMGDIYSMIGQLRVTGDVFEDRSTARILYTERSLRAGTPLLINR